MMQRAITADVREHVNLTVPRTSWPELAQAMANDRWRIHSRNPPVHAEGFPKLDMTKVHVRASRSTGNRMVMLPDWEES